MMNRRFKLLIFLLLMVCSSSSSAEDGAQCIGKIEKINFNINLNLSYKSLIRGIDLSPGMECSVEKIESAVKILTERKIFSKIDYNLVESEKGLILNFFLEPLRVLSEIELFGTSILKKKDLRRAILFRPGDTLDTDSAEVARERLVTYYRDQGFLNVLVRVDTRVEDTLPLVSFLFWIEEGKANVVSKVEFKGEDLDKIKDELDNIRSRTEGVILSKYFKRKLKQDAYQILRDKGYYQARIGVFSDGDVVTYDIKPRLKIDFVISGNSSFRQNKILSSLRLDSRLVPLRANIVDSLCEDVRRLYRESAFMDVQVQCRDEDRLDLNRIIIEIIEGSRYKIRSPMIEGVEKIPSSQLSSHLYPPSAGLFAFPPAPTEESLEVDTNSIRDAYRDLGYGNVNIESKLQIDSENKTVGEYFLVEERGELKIEEVVCNVEGEDKQTELLDICYQKLGGFKGERYIDSSFQPLGEDLQKAILAEGYPNAVSTVVFDSATSSLDVRISQGVRTKVGRIVCAGNYFTQDFLILRELLLKEGAVWDSTKLEESKQILFGLGIFSSVQISPLDGEVNSDTEDLLVQVREKETGIMQGLFELSSQDGLHLQTQLAQRNLFGSGRAVILGVDGYFKQGFADFDAARTRLAYASPKIFNSGLDYSIEGFFQTALNLNRSFKLNREGLTQSLRYPLLKSLKLNLSQTFYNERAYDVNSELILGPRDTGSTVYSGVKGALEFDRRDDPFLTTRGYRFEIGGGFLPESLGSETGLAEGHFDGSTVVPVSTNNAYALHLRGGLLQPLNDEVVPLGSRYFIGGRDTLRGYSRYQVGPRSSGGVVVGGDTLLVLSQEFRHNLQGGITILGFLDIAQAMLRNDGGFGGDAKNSLAGLRYSPGVGMQYGTPIGPLTAELGLATDKEFGERWGRFIISIGNAF